MPSCQRVSTYHSKEQRLYSQQAQAMLLKSPEYQRFAKTQEQTEDLRLSWVLGIMFFVIMLYADIVVFVTESGDGNGLLGGFLRLDAFPKFLTSFLSVCFLLYPVGWMFLAPWFGVTGAVEYTRLRNVVVGHIAAAALFALASDIKVSSFIEEWRMPTIQDVQFSQTSLTLKGWLPTFIGGLVPLVTGAWIRWWLCSGSWRSRSVVNLPHLWLPPLHFFLTVPAMFSLTYALRRLMTDTEQVTPATLFSNPELILAEAGTVLRTMSKVSNVRTWGTASGALALNQYVVFTATYLLLLITTQMELYLFTPIVKKILLPSGGRRLALYFAGLCIFGLKYWSPDHDKRPLVWYMIVGYAGTLLFRGLPSRGEEDGEDAADDEE